MTGWNNGLSQDYDRGLGRWFADRLGSRNELRNTMTHNIETLMALSDAQATERVHAHYHPEREARATLSVALTEVLAERDAAHMDGYEGGKQEARDAAHAEIDALAKDAALWRKHEQELSHAKNAKN